MQKTEGYRQNLQYFNALTFVQCRFLFAELYIFVCTLKYVAKTMMGSSTPINNLRSKNYGPDSTLGVAPLRLVTLGVINRSNELAGGSHAYIWTQLGWVNISRG